MNDSDISHSSGPRSRIERLANQERAVPRMLDQLPVLPPRDLDHEVAPTMPPAAKSGSEQIAEKMINDLRQTGQTVLDQFPPLHEQLNQAEQMVIRAMADGEENIHAQMRFMETAVKIAQHVKQQLSDAVRPLAALVNGSNK